MGHRSAEYSLRPTSDAATSWKEAIDRAWQDELSRSDEQRATRESEETDSCQVANP
ncbi:hypothetical protein [Halovenus marina]|uniref:hypothetical protein n=1 Tax=Halovenus marina TaxID=3396621 RepID=UPI003F555519